MNPPAQALDGAEASSAKPVPDPDAASAAAAPGSSPEAIFDGGDDFIDDGIMRANWSVPWSDLMMTMFVLFAALLAAQTMHERLRESAQQQTAEDGGDARAGANARDARERRGAAARAELRAAHADQRIRPQPASRARGQPADAEIVLMTINQ